MPTKPKYGTLVTANAASTENTSPTNGSASNGSSEKSALLLADPKQQNGQTSTAYEKITRDAYIFVLCAALNSCNLGYDVGVSTKVGRLVEKDFDLTRLERELFVASINFWASKYSASNFCLKNESGVNLISLPSVFGSLGAHYLTDTYGRRHTFLVAAIGCDRSLSESLPFATIPGMRCSYLT